MNTVLDPSREQAAQMLAEGRYGYGEIAQKIGFEVRTLHNWRKDPEFASRVEEIQAEFNEAALKRGIARKEYRIKVLADKESKLLEVMEARAKDLAGEIAGGETGLLVRKPVTSKEGIVGFEYAVDTGTLRELRAIHEQVAKELGQVVEKREVKADVTHSLKDATDAELDRELSKLLSGSHPEDGPEDEGEDAGDSAGAGPEEETEG